MRTNDYRDVFSKEVSKLEGTVVASEAFQYSDFDFKTQITKLNENKFDAIYLIGLDYQLVTAIKQIRGQNIRSQIIAVGTVATKDSIEKAGAAIDGTYVTAFCTDGAPLEYVEKFQTMYGRYPGFFSEFGYDIGQMINFASKDISGNSVERKNSIRDKLITIHNFPGNLGPVTSKSYGEMSVPVCVKKITEGKIFNTSTGKYSNY